MKKSYLLLLVLLLSACSVNNQSDNTGGSNANSVNVPVSTTLPSENSKDSESTSSIPEDSSKNSKSEASVEPSPITEDFEVYVYEFDYETYEERIYKGSEYTCNYDAVYGLITFLIKCNTEIDVQNDFNVLVSLNESDYYGIYYQPATETSEGDFEGYGISLRYGYRGTFTITFETIDFGGKTININVI